MTNGRSFILGIFVGAVAVAGIGALVLKPWSRNDAVSRSSPVAEAGSTTIPATPKYAAAALEPKGFQELPWGASEAAAKPKFQGDFSCSARDDVSIRDCYCWTGIGDAPVNLVLTFVDGKFVGVYGTFYTQRWWPTVRDVMVERFGPPTRSETVPVTTAMNAKFDNERLVWGWPDVKVQAARFAGKIDKGELSVELRSWSERQRAMQAESVKSAARSF